jgi:hypothetical protein
MNKQFFYKRVIKQKEGEDLVVMDCFGLNCVVRAVWHENKFIILLNDGHEASEYISAPVLNKAGKMIKDGQKVRHWKVSEIVLDIEDAKRFYEATTGESSDTFLIPVGKVKFEEAEVVLD